MNVNEIAIYQRQGYEQKFTKCASVMSKLQYRAARKLIAYSNRSDRVRRFKLITFKEKESCQTVLNFKHLIIGSCLWSNISQ